MPNRNLALFRERMDTRTVLTGKGVRRRALCTPWPRTSATIVLTVSEEEVQEMAIISDEEGSIMPYEADLVRTS